MTRDEERRLEVLEEFRVFAPANENVLLAGRLCHDCGRATGSKASRCPGCAELAAARSRRSALGRVPSEGERAWRAKREAYWRSRGRGPGNRLVLA